MNKTVVGDNQKRNRAQYIRNEMQDCIGNAIIDNFLSQHIADFIALESSFDNNKTSRVGAVGVIQIIPRNLTGRAGKILNLGGYNFDEVRKSYKKQGEIAKNLFKDIYIYNSLNKYIQPIADIFYHGNKEKAQIYFIAPLIFNSYNAGSSTISNALKQFLAKYPNQSSLMQALKANYNQGMGFDAFWAFTKFARKQENSYGSDAEKYIVKGL